MHAVNITFRTKLGPEQIPEAFAHKAPMIAEAAKGLIMKAFCYNGSNVCGFYLFTSHATAQAWVEGPQMAGAKEALGMTDLVVRYYEVAEEASRITGTPTEVLRRAA